jgi:hypothetical protein
MVDASEPGNGKKLSSVFNRDASLAGCKSNEEKYKEA